MFKLLWVIVLLFACFQLGSAKEMTFTLNNKVGPSSVASVSCKDSVFYVLVPGFGLQVWDLSDPRSPEKVSELPFDFSSFSSNKADMEIVGDFLFLTDGDVDGGFHGFDISAPYSPQRLDRYFIHGTPQAMAVHDQKAYILNSSGELNILDISDSQNFLHVSCVDIDGGEDMAINYPYLYVGRWNGLATYNIQDPLNPQYQGEISLAGNPRQISLGSTHAFLAVDQVGVVILDIQNPGQPAMYSTLSTGQQTIGVAVQGHTLHVTTQDQGLLVFDASKINQIQIQSQVSIEAGDSRMAFYSQGVLVPGFDVHEQLHIVNVNELGQTMLEASLPAPLGLQNIQAQGNIVYVSDSYNGLDVLDFSTTPATRIAQLDVPGTSGFLTRHGQTLYLLSNLDLYVIDVSIPSSPQLGPSIEVGAISEMKVHADRAYIAGGVYGLTILDVSHPLAPVEIGHYDGSSRIYDIEFKGNIAYLAQYDGRISVVDISDPGSIVLVNEVMLFEGMYRLTMGNDDALFALSLPGYGSFYVLDVSQATVPQQVYKAPVPYSFYEMEVLEGTLFARNSSSIVAFDIEKPFSPRLIGRFSRPSYSGDMALSENHLYVGEYDEVMQVGYHSWRNRWDEVWPQWNQATEQPLCGGLSNDILGMVAFANQDGYCQEGVFTIDLGAEGFDMVFDPVRGKLYVSLFQEDTILIINSETLLIEERLTVPNAPMGLDLSSDGHTLLMALHGSGEVAFLDLVSRTTTYVNVEAATGHPQLYDVVEGRPGFVYASADSDSAFTYLAEIDVASGNLVSRVAGGNVIWGNATFAKDPTGSSLYVANIAHHPNSLDKIDISQAGAPIVLESPHGHLRESRFLCVNPDGSLLQWGGGQLLRTEDLFHTDLLEEGAPFFSASGTYLYVLTSDDRLLKYQTDPVSKLDEWSFPLSNLYEMRQLLVFPNECKAVGLRGHTLYGKKWCP